MGLPSIGLYTATKKQKGMRLCITEAYGDNPDEFYLVTVCDEESVDDMSAMADEMDKEQWESLVDEFGLEHQAVDYVTYCIESEISLNSDASRKEYERHLEKVGLLKKMFSPDVNDEDRDRLLAELYK